MLARSSRMCFQSVNLDLSSFSKTNGPKRQDLLGTTKCSFLDFRNEIESARKDPGRTKSYRIHTSSKEFAQDA